MATRRMGVCRPHPSGFFTMMPNGGNRRNRYLHMGRILVGHSGDAHLAKEMLATPISPDYHDRAAA
jgi:hypothetical protein